ncbi:MAG: hypothetical protein E7533_00830 [Ruminococcaceae bacterium]|nr:hypothetical protein [Oscillospiraceae bacterium]
MLKKLLKYDFKSVFKYWWIAAVTITALSIGAGFCGEILNSEKELPAAALVISTLVIVLVALSLFAFLTLSQLLVYIRFYKNLFTDEGYLTFTLPVKRNHILNSKLLLGSATTLSTGLLVIIDILIILCITFRKEIFNKVFFKDLFDNIEMIVEEVGVFYIASYIFEGLLCIILFVVISALFTFMCITIASIIAKKAKIVTAIALYYGASSLITFFTQMFFMFGIGSITEWVFELSDETIKLVVFLILLMAVFFLGAIAMAFYTFQYRMLDRKLNLS